MKHLIVNADDFGYSSGINRGIVEAHVNGIVTSTSVMVNGNAAQEAQELVQYPQLSLGLHLELTMVENVQLELEKQIHKFIELIGKKPDHIDTHKLCTIDHGIREVLEKHHKLHRIPIRDFGVKHISSFGVKTGDASVNQLKRSIDEATDEYNELMCHVGYSDDYLRQRSSYHEQREQELTSICDPFIRQYIAKNRLQLINWRQVS